MSLSWPSTITKESLGLSGKLFCDEIPQKTKGKPESRDELDDFCAFMGIQSKLCSSKNPVDSQPRDLLKIDVEKELEGSVKQLDSLQRLSQRQKKKRNKELRDKAKGSEWFNMPATEMTDDIKNDMKVLQMRSALDPKHFYKRNDMAVLPKYFQVGKYVDSPLDYHQEKHLKKNKSRTIVDDLLKDAEFQKKIKRKYKEIASKEKPYFRHRKNVNRKDRKRGKGEKKRK